MLVRATTLTLVSLGGGTYTEQSCHSGRTHVANGRSAQGGSARRIQLSVHNSYDIVEACLLIVVTVGGGTECSHRRPSAVLNYSTTSRDLTRATLKISAPYWDKHWRELRYASWIKGWFYNISDPPGIQSDKGLAFVQNTAVGSQETGYFFAREGISYAH